MAPKNRGKSWSDEATRTLIQLWAEETVQIALDTCKTSKEIAKIYQELLGKLREKGYEDFTLKEITNKMKKLRQRYKQEKDKSRQTGNSAGKKWEFFDDIDRFLSKRHNVTPLTVVDTMSMEEEKITNNEKKEKEDLDSEDTHRPINATANSGEVHRMCEKYGSGETSVRKCATCDYEQELRSSGVHCLEGGSISVYADDDEFSCPNCDNHNQDDIDISLSMSTDEQSKTNIDPIHDGTNSSEKMSSQRKRKSNFERSLEVVFSKFSESTAEDFERLRQLEDNRMRKEHDFRLQEMKLQDERRQKEREHELQMMRLIMTSPQLSQPSVPATTRQHPFNVPVFYGSPNTPTPSSCSSEFESTTSTFSEDGDISYFKL